ncbi:FBX15-like protein [Mya arenaria]|uniref:FBX15-like protein n=1 Tax=Mya arenaria TaxID=6604 RepID=A0ABY7EUP7_MYAAR|nr:FBX15-like protein [Mya arenaria]
MASRHREHLAGYLAARKPQSGTESRAESNRGAQNGSRDVPVLFTSSVRTQATPANTKSRATYLRARKPLHLPKGTGKAHVNESAGVYFQMSMTDQDDNEITFRSQDVFYHQMSASVRWFDLQMPAINSIKKLSFIAMHPLFYTNEGKAMANSPFQKSLLLSVKFDWQKWLKSNKPAGFDDMVNIYSLPDGLALATWKNVVWIDVVVLDERKEPFWCVSSLCRVSSEKNKNNFDFDYTSDDAYKMSFMDERGKLEALMSMTDDGLYFMTQLDLKLSLDAINKWFGTSYR